MNHLLKEYAGLLHQQSAVFLNIKVIPKAQRTEAVEIMEGPDGEQIVKIKVAAVPEKGKANKALCEYFAKAFGVSKSQVEVVQGQTSQRKVVRICNANE